VVIAVELASETRRKASEQLRFHRGERLLGSPLMADLKDRHVMVVGLGGVGSWAAEMLVRTGIGRVTVVDHDRICITNTNRQSHALHGTIGKTKADVLAARMRLINPAATVDPVIRFYNAESSDELLDSAPDLVLDAIDNLTAKAHLIASCQQKNIAVISSMGAAARLDPTKIRVADIGATTIDPMAKSMRKILRQQYQLSEGVRTVYSVEPPNAAQATETPYDNVCVCPAPDGGVRELHTCDHRNVILGTVGYVTAAFGMAMVSEVIRHFRPAPN
jgi:tRNA A37 threonylcarbamoyladenosine dehydratase